MRVETVKNILLGVTGGIAAYKAAELCRIFIKAGHNVKVVMTQNAQEFIHRNTFAALTHQPVYDDMFDPQQAAMLHIDLAKWADQIVIAPATSSTLARLALGLADDLLSTVCLATTAGIFIAPAMNKVMWEHAAVQANINKLQTYGYHIISPGSGEQACGDVGFGRMAEPEMIAKFISAKSKSLLNSLRVLITAGPTREAIDPIRFISNHSSGKMGYALAQAYADTGAEVTLVSGPTQLASPMINSIVNVNSAADMLAAVMDHIDDVDIFISCAAVADYVPVNQAQQKIKKSVSDSLTLELTKTTDILTAVTQHTTKPFIVGFSAETDNLIENSKQKLQRKKLDAIIANQIHSSGEPFNQEHNTLTYINKNLDAIDLGHDSKVNLAKKIVAQIQQSCEKHYDLA